MGRKLHIYAGRTRLCIKDNEVVEFFRRSKSLKYSIKHSYKIRRYEKNISGCTDKD